MVLQWYKLNKTRLWHVLAGGEPLCGIKRTGGRYSWVEPLWDPQCRDCVRTFLAQEVQSQVGQPALRTWYRHAGTGEWHLMGAEEALCGLKPTDGHISLAEPFGDHCLNCVAAYRSPPTPSLGRKVRVPKRQDPRWLERPPR